MSEPTGAELAPDVARKLIDTGRLFHALAADPKHRKKVLGLIKEAAPETVIPELEIEADMERRVSEAVKPHADSTAEMRAELNDLRQQLARKDMATKLGLDDAELVEVETFAKDNAIGNVEKAKEFYEMRAQILGTPRATRDPGAEDYTQKLRKINPRNHAGLKRAAIEEGNRILRSIRRAG
jgi:hypothetical protein